MLLNVSIINEDFEEEKNFNKENPIIISPIITKKIASPAVSPDKTLSTTRSELEA